MTFKNESGIRPVEYKVLVKPDVVEGSVDVAGTDLKIYLPEQITEREGWAQIAGTLVARGESAFSDWTNGERALLKPGVRVYFDKYQGIQVKGADGEDYALMNDKNIAAILETQGAAPVSVLHGRTPGKLKAV